MAVEKSQVFVCGVCGNSVEAVRSGSGTLVCCSVPMTLLAENSTDAAQEKHVPVIEKVPEGIRVKVGSAPHPMEEQHFIEWIEATLDGRQYRQYLSPGAAPEAVFPIEAEQLTARAICNLHGLWKGQ